MDFNKLIARVKGILMAPKSEWPQIAAEPASTASIYTGYVLWLAAIPAIFNFIKGSLIGYGAFGVHYRQGIASGIGSAILTYILTLVVVFVVALIINALAGTFAGQKNQVQALKTAGYAYTASWVASIGVIIPWLGWLIAIAGGIYSIYLLYLGLPHTMKCPPEKAAGYTAVTVILAIILGWLLAMIVGGIFAVGSLSGGHYPGAVGGDSVTIDEDSKLGALAAMGARMEAAGNKMEHAAETGDTDAQDEAFGAMMGALAGNNGKVESLSADAIKSFIPETLDGLERVSIKSERKAAMGLQVSEASAEYSDGESRRLRLSITDTGSMQGMMGLARTFGGEMESETATGYEKRYQEDGRMVEEKWDRERHYGSYSTSIADRFQVEISGKAASIDDLKDAVHSLDFDAMAELAESPGNG